MPSKSLDLFIFVDALGWKQVQERDFLADILPHRQKCQTVFGYSSTCDPTILTGKMPDQHGHFSCFIKATEERPFKHLGKLGFLPQKIAGYHRVRNRVSRYLGNFLGYTGYFQIYSVPFQHLQYLDYTEKRDIYKKGGILAGHDPIFEFWEKSGKAWTRSDWHNPDDVNIAHMRDEIDKADTELGYLFLGKPDAIMHQHGTSGPEVDAGFDKLGKDLRELYELAQKNYKEVRFHVFSDHGMSDTTAASDLWPRWKQAFKHAKYGRDYVGVWDSTMARFWFEDDSVRQEAHQFLNEAGDGGRIVSKEELTRWHCNFENDKYGETFYLLSPGSIFAPSFMNQRWVNGMHGYEPEHEECDASWLTNAEGRHASHLSEIFPNMLAASKEQVRPASEQLLAHSR
ncbi:MAG: hypothetical protein ACI8XO_000549 [Verrucomicrobiales bacterium]